MCSYSPVGITGREAQVEHGQQGEQLAHCKGHLRFDRVAFSYPSRMEAAVLREVSFEVQAGQVCAIVGASGAGKSTLFHLLQHFYEPTAGQITLDGTNLSMLDHGWLHRHVAMVGQEPVLFSGTIAYNITYGVGGDDELDKRPPTPTPAPAVLDRSLEAPAANTVYGIGFDDDPEQPGSAQQRHGGVPSVEAVARDANAHDFISALPQGYNTEVGERGMQLSGGDQPSLQDITII